MKILLQTFRSRSRKSVIISAPALAKKGGSGSATLLFYLFDIIYLFYLFFTFYLFYIIYPFYLFFIFYLFNLFNVLYLSIYSRAERVLSGYYGFHVDADDEVANGRLGAPDTLIFKQQVMRRLNLTLAPNICNQETQLMRQFCVLHWEEIISNTKNSSCRWGIHRVCNYYSHKQYCMFHAS